MALRTLLVDDEPLARRGLVLRLAGEPDVEIVGECGNGEDAVRAVSQLEPDLMFLDVQMPGLDGFATLRAIPASQMPLVVFVTAYDHYAIRAFEASAVDYVLKPIDDSRLAQALYRESEASRLRRERLRTERLAARKGGLGGTGPLGGNWPNQGQAEDHGDTGGANGRGVDGIAIGLHGEVLRLGSRPIHGASGTDRSQCTPASRAGPEALDRTLRGWLTFRHSPPPGALRVPLGSLRRRGAGPDRRTGRGSELP